MSNERRKIKTATNCTIHTNHSPAQHVKVRLYFHPIHSGTQLDVNVTNELECPIHNTTTMQVGMVHYVDFTHGENSSEWSDWRTIFSVVVPRLLTSELNRVCYGFGKKVKSRARVRLNSIITIILWCFFFVVNSHSLFYNNLLELTIPALVQRFNDYSIWWGSWTLQRALLLIPDVSHQLCVRATREWFSVSLAPSLCVCSGKLHDAWIFISVRIVRSTRENLFCSCLSQKIPILSIISKNCSLHIWLAQSTSQC